MGALRYVSWFDACGLFETLRTGRPALLKFAIEKPVSFHSGYSHGGGWCLITLVDGSRFCGWCPGGVAWDSLSVSLRTELVRRAEDMAMARWCVTGGRRRLCRHIRLKSRPYKYLNRYKVGRRLQLRYSYVPTFVVVKRCWIQYNWRFRFHQYVSVSLDSTIADPGLWPTLPLLDGPGGGLLEGVVSVELPIGGEAPHCTPSSGLAASE